MTPTRLGILAVAIFIVVPLFAISAKPPDSNKAEIAAIKTLFDTFNNAFNDHNAQAIGACFTKDADFINVVGATTRGSTEIEEHSAALFAGRLKTGHRDVTNMKIRFLTPDVATVDSDYVMSAVTGPNGAEMPAAKGIYDWVVVKKDGRWLIAVWHETNLPGPAQAPGR